MLDYSSQLCLLLVVSIVCFLIVMNRLSGRLTKLPQFVNHLNFDMFTVKPKFLTLYLTAVFGTILFMPIITIVAWALFLFSENKSRAAISVVLLGLAALLTSYGVVKIKWNNWRFKKVHRLILLAGYACFTAWQFFIVFTEPAGLSTYVGLSGVFLTQNGLIATFIIFINLKTHKFTLKTIFDNYLDPAPQQASDPNRDL